MVEVICKASVSQLSKLKSCRRAPALPLHSQDGACLGRVVSIVLRYTFFTFCSAPSGYFQCPEFCWFCQCERPTHWKSVFEVRKYAVWDRATDRLIHKGKYILKLFLQSFKSFLLQVYLTGTMSICPSSTTKQQLYVDLETRVYVIHISKASLGGKGSKKQLAILLITIPSIHDWFLDRCLGWITVYCDRSVRL